jgi:fatty acid desaturase
MSPEPAQTLASRHRTKQRVLKVWGYVICLFALISALAIGMTGEPRGIYVVGGVTFALGLLGTMMAVLTGHRPDGRKAEST